jgi:hypothetical protein
MTRKPAMSTRAKAAADALAPGHLAETLDAARTLAAAAWDAPAVASAPVLWLRHHDDEFAPPPAADVAQLRAALLALEAEDRATRWPPAATPAEAPTSALDAPLCALCRGRCCRFGLDGRAFLEPQHLRAWLDHHPEASWAEAVDHWLAFIGPEHLRGSCLFHGRDGCTLPRERRSDVCNQFACDALEQARDIAVAAPDGVVVAGIAAGHTLRGAAVVSARGSRAIEP